MTDARDPFHAHIYYDASDRSAAEQLHSDLRAKKGTGDLVDVLFVGAMTDRPVGPHPIPQYEVHFRDQVRPEVTAAIAASGLRALVHPLTDDDLTDHTTLAQWIGEPLKLDLSVLDPPGKNQGVPRFGKADF